MKLFNYYNEYSTYLASLDGNKKYLINKNIKFLGVEENINCYIFELKDGKQILRIIDKKFVSYEPISNQSEP